MSSLSNKITTSNHNENKKMEVECTWTTRYPDSREVQENWCGFEKIKEEMENEKNEQ